MGAVILMLVMGGVLTAGLGISGGSDTNAEGGDNSERIDGSDANDSLSGGGGNDLLLGEQGDDTLSGDIGNDWLLGGPGDDLIHGGEGNDVLIGGTGSDQILAGAGDDFVESANIVDQEQLDASVENASSLSQLRFAYDLPGTSDQGDTIDLGPGNDTVVAGDNDTLTGGEGEDEFALGDWISGGNPVEITDFDMAEDIITIAFAEDGPTPEVEVKTDPATGVKTIYADGQAIAVVPGVAPEFSVRNVAITSYVT